MVNKLTQRSAPNRGKKGYTNKSWFSRHISQHLNVIAALAVMTGLAGVGYYFHYVDAIPDFIFVDECGRWHDPGTIWSDCDVSRDYPAGQTITVPVYGNTLIADYFGLPSRPNQLHAQVTLYHYDSPLTYGSYVCAAGNTCKPGIKDSAYSGPAIGDDGTICVQINPASIGTKKYPLFNVQYPKHAGTRTGFEDGSYEIDGHVYWKTGNCNNDNTGCTHGMLPALCHSAFVLAAYGNAKNDGGGNPPNPGPPNSGPPSTQPDGPGDGPGKTGDGTGDAPQTTKSKSGSSSGKSSATKQGQRTNSIPSSTSQGSNTTPTVAQPSPFYDGKQYTAGSDADKQSAVAFLHKATVAASYRWAIAIVTIAAISAGVTIWWRQSHRR